MKILITGICGFVGSQLAIALSERLPNPAITGLDNLLRPGSEGNRGLLAQRGIRVYHGDLRMRSDLDAMPTCDWVIDAAAQPSVLAGVDGRSSPRQLSEHNLSGTLNILEYCRERNAGLVLLSTSRVYSIRELAALPMIQRDHAFVLDESRPLPSGVTAVGLAENFPVRQPISLYGATKLASEIMAVEYASTFNFPVWINRCGVLAGAGQFGTAEQGIFSYWLHAHAARLPLRYIGFGGTGCQVRDAFHPSDLAELISLQLHRKPSGEAVLNVGGGPENAMSLAQLTSWCDERFGHHQPQPDARPRPFDIPWVIMDSSQVRQQFGWAPQRTLASILDEISAHAREHPDWLSVSGAL